MMQDNKTTVNEHLKQNASSDTDTHTPQMNGSHAPWTGISRHPRT